MERDADQFRHHFTHKPFVDLSQVETESGNDRIAARFTRRTVFLFGEILVSNGSNKENAPSEPVCSLAGPDTKVSMSEQQSSMNLADILEQILSTSEDPLNFDVDPCQKELLAIASKYSSLEFCIDPVLNALIHVTTRRIKGLAENRLLAMERAVAASLVEDQVSHARLLNFWEQLKVWAANEQ